MIKRNIASAYVMTHPKKCDECLKCVVKDSAYGSLISTQIVSSDRYTPISPVMAHYQPSKTFHLVMIYFEYKLTTFSRDDCF